MNSHELGLYIHIPFCARLCHYCDFAKTANFDDGHVAQYFSTLNLQLKSWIERLGSDVKFTSVFFGGGTPGLFTNDYQNIFDTLRPHLAADAEITLEANPHNIQLESLELWRNLGFNRLSVGVQSFDPLGLKALTRDHSAAEAIAALKLARTVFNNVNGDLIYSWPGQTMESWNKDLRQMVNLGVSHISLYALTFEGNTPFARANRRGKLPAAPDETQEEFYLQAKDILEDFGFEHEEISNWAKPGFSCRHNWLYWTASHFVGIGAGAHGFVPSHESFGTRYSYPGDLRSYLRDCQNGSWSDGIVEDCDRGTSEWLMEYVGCGLRTRQGIDLKKITAIGWSFVPNPTVARALKEDILTLESDILRLRPQDWFRETSWSYQVLESFKGP